jgi:hypothetical protein
MVMPNALPLHVFVDGYELHISPDDVYVMMIRQDRTRTTREDDVSVCKFLAIFFQRTFARLRILRFDNVEFTDDVRDTFNKLRLDMTHIRLNSRASPRDDRSFFSKSSVNTLWVSMNGSTEHIPVPVSTQDLSSILAWPPSLIRPGRL